MIDTPGVTSLSELAAVHGMRAHHMRHYYQLLQNYWYFMLAELDEALTVDSGVSPAGQASLRAYMSLLGEFERTGFLDIQD